MASGIQVADGVKDLYNSMKVVRTTDDENERVRVAILAIEESLIVVKKQIKNKDLDGCAFSEIEKEMKEISCFYALYDCHYQTTDHPDNYGLILLVWSSDDCSKIKDKMMYASSVDSLKKVLSGGGVKKMQVNDFDQWTREEVAKKIQGSGARAVTKIENIDI